mgnify:CR=1 FL=1
MSKFKKYFTKQKYLFLFSIFLLFFSSLIIIGQENNNNIDDKNLNDINKNLSIQNETKEIRNSNSIAAFFVRTLIVLLILLIVYFIVKYRFSKSIDDKNKNNHFSILLKEQISRNVYLAVLEFYGSYYIISIANDINILEKIENQEIIDAIKLDAGKEQPKKTFLDYLGLGSNKNDNSNALLKFNQLKEKMNNLKKGNKE